MKKDRLQLAPRPSSSAVAFTQIFHYGNQKKGFTFQIIFPPVKLLDTGLHAFLTPFLLTGWICILASLVGISVWLILTEGVTILQLMFWHFSTLLEQDVYQLKVSKFQSHVIIVIFIFSAIVFRQFYCSCLYSFMVAEPKVTHYPKNIDELLNQTEYKILTPRPLVMKAHSIFLSESSKKISKAAIFLERILLVSFVMQLNRDIHTLQNASNHHSLEVFRYSTTANAKGTKLATGWANKNQVSINLERFAVICDDNCEGHWKLPFLEQTQWYRVSEEQMQFFTTYTFWAQTYPNFATLGFSRFLGGFVESGLNERASQQHRVSRQFELSKGLSNLQQSGMENGSLWSYLMLGNDVERFVKAKEEPTKVSALIGTFGITGAILVMASIVFAVEVICNWF
ncbi:unnamed protein product [Orchesella dallaii]|uniref:Uncharacterized protein n=1 Tax=Orchesella dallaii TaxID=48710 RepID=A0ABP1RQD2_9HEXA